MSQAIIDQTSKNIALVGQFIDELFEDDALLADVSHDIPLILVPVDDVSLAQANFEMALQAGARGEKIRLHIVGCPPLSDPSGEE